MKRLLVSVSILVSMASCSPLPKLPRTYHQYVVTQQHEDVFMSQTIVVTIVQRHKNDDKAMKSFNKQYKPDPKDSVTMEYKGKFHRAKIDRSVFRELKREMRNSK